MSLIAYRIMETPIMDEVPDDFTVLDAAVLILDEDGDFRVDHHGRGEKNVLWGDWASGVESGEFYLIPVRGTIVSSIDLTGSS
jgi:hypothetical protein